MAQVPYTPYPAVEPTEPRALRPELNVRATPEAFGVGTAQALRGLGQQIEKSSDEVGNTLIWSQNLASETRAKQGFVDASEKIGQAESDFYSKKGQNAVDAKDQYTQQIKQIYQDALDNTQTPTEKRMLGDTLSRRISYSIVDGQRHAGQQQLESMNQVSTARVAAAVAASSAHPYDDNMWGDTIATIKSEALAQSEHAGAGAEAAQVNVDKWTAMAWQNRLEAIGFQNPDAAKKLFDEHRDEIKGIHPDGTPYAQRIEAYLENRDNAVGTRIYEDQIFRGGGSFAAKVSGAERDPTRPLTGRAPTSSATGLYQFTQGTWDDMRKANPELNLPSTVRAATAEQQGAAFEALTARNEGILKDRNIEPTDQNKYTMHVFGAAGGPRFIEGVQADPTQPATNLADKGAVDANHNLFYHKDGSVRSAGELYSLFGAKMAGGPGPLTRDSGGEWLQTALDQVHDISVANNKSPQFEDLLRSRVITQFNQRTEAIKKQDYGDYLQVLGPVMGAAGGQRMTDFKQVLDNPGLYDVYNRLPLPRQQEIQNHIRINASRGPDPTAQSEELFWNTYGLVQQAKSNPTARDQLTTMDMSKVFEVLPHNQADKIKEGMIQVKDAWDRKQQALEQATHFNGIMAGVRPMLNTANIHESTTDRAANDRFLTFQGRMYARYQEYVQTSQGKPPDKQWMDSTAADLLQQMPRGAGGWSPFFPGYKFEVPKEKAAILQEEYTKAGGQGTLPANILGTLYEKALASKDPEVRRRLGL